MTIYRLMKELRTVYPVAAMADVYNVSTSGFYDWLHRMPSRRHQRREAVTDAVREVFDQSDAIYGSRKIARELAEREVNACRNTVAKIMRRMNLRSRAQKRRFVVTTDSSHLEPVAPNTLDRRFEASAPNRKWVADLTYIPTAEGFVYLAAVMDLYSRRIVGWALSDSLESSIVLDALDQAIRTRLPEPGLLHHSDRGTQYASARHRTMLSDHGIECSMSRRGNCWDNAPMERFMNSLKNEWTNHQPIFKTIEETRTSVFRYIEIFYNRERRHQALGYFSPCRFEEEAA